jgi:hypothetical protein
VTTAIPGSGTPAQLPWPLPRWLLISLLLVTALGIRLHHSGDPPLNFHATRQYRSLIIARGVYYDHLTSLPDWKQRVASCSRQNQGVLEPPIMEHAVATFYRMLGGERLWLPRLLSSLFWLAGGVFLYLIGRRIAGEDAALFAAAFYLFLPFAVVASRGFQPDPLMVMLMLAGVWAALRYDELSSTARLIAAAGLASAAVLVKPGSVFVVVAAFLALSVSRQGVRALWSRSLWVFVAITLLPTQIVYGYGVVSGTFLVHEAQKTVLPQLWTSSFFWRGWLNQIGSTVGFVCFIGALLGTAIFRQGRPRTLMVALWAGYIAFALALNYNLATHDYYQLQLVPIAGLGLGGLVALIMNHLLERETSLLWRLAIWSTWALALALSLAEARARIVDPVAGDRVAIQEHIGEQVRHSTRTIFLSGDYGVPLEYNGLLCGKSWPLGWDLEWERLAGRPALPAEARYQRRYAEAGPEYFIIEDVTEFARQPDLERFLSRFPVVARDSSYVIFKLVIR